MEFHQITYFLAACDMMNFTRAAEVCNVSQPSLTVAIRKLEQELGGALFVREARALSLTDLGRAMRTHLGRIAETRESARQAARQVVGHDTEMIDLGLMCTVSPALLSDAFAAWHRVASRVELVVHDVWGAKAQELLLAGSLDAALIAHTEALPQRFDAQPLFSEPMVLAMSGSHPLAARRSLTLRDLDGAAYLDRLRCEFRTLFLDDIDKNDLNLDVVLKSEREDWIQHALCSGVGVAMVPQSMARATGLEMRPIEGMNISRSVSLVTVRDRPQSPAMQQLADALKGFDFRAADSASPDAG